MRYFLHLAYNGTPFHGWQIQPNAPTVQETLEKALAIFCNEKINIVGCGRTDTGVHAKKFYAHFDTAQQFDEKQLAHILHKINAFAGENIVLYRIFPVADDLHARFSATRRTYHYFVHLRKNPFRRSYSWQLYGDIDFHRMNEAAKVLLEYRDFTSFSKVNTDTKTNECTIVEAHWDELEPGVWRFTITANRFLRNMVRAIVGTLIEVGRGKLSIEDFRDVIEQKNRCSAGESVPGHGLFLVDISYDLKDSKDFKEQ